MRRRCGGGCRRDRPRQFAAVDLRPRLPAGDAVRRGLRARHQGRAGGCGQARTVRGRLEHRPCGAARRGVAGAQRPSGGCRGERACGSGLCERLGQDGLRSEDFRGVAQGGRGAGLRHSGVPTAQAEDRRARGRGREAAGRRDRDRRDRRAHGDGRFAARRGGIRRRVHRFGCRSAAFHGDRGREPERGGLGQRIPYARQSDARLRRALRSGSASW